MEKSDLSSDRKWTGSKVNVLCVHKKNWHVQFGHINIPGMVKKMVE